MSRQEGTQLRALWQALNETTRVRLVALLSDAELSVSELQKITMLSQSLISSHLGVLRKADLVSTRKEGKSIYYQLKPTLSPKVQAIISACLNTLNEIPECQNDKAELKNTLSRRREAAQNYFNKIAGKMGKAYCPGRTWSAVGPLLAHLVGDVTVADLGAGEGWLSLLLAQRARNVIAIDSSPKMVEFAEEQLRGNKITNVEYRLGNLENPPLEPDSVDIVIFSQALHHAESPDLAIKRGATLLKQGGVLVILDLQKHQFEKAREIYHDYWMGFAESDLQNWLRAAGLTKLLIQALEPDPNDPVFVPILASGCKP
ncbi:MAG: metalloregulator ArsR/SmtB family transcription factor [Verrucomicrobiota bacterium]